jgi:polysaccharide chain length determinant protein (PEP-CTERM system associated)
VLKAQAQLELREAENSRDTLKRQLAGEEPVITSESPSGASAVGLVPEIDSRLDVQNRNLDALLQRFTEKHPDVVGTRRMIKELEEQRLGELAARRYAAKLNPAAGSFNTNPVYQKLKIALAEAEAAVAARQVRVSEFESRHAKAVSMIKAMPEIEAEYAQLNRDYEVNKKNYESLLQRRESAAISEGMADIASVADFRIIDPPRTTPTPVAPNRIVLLALAFLGSLAAGMATAFAASQIKPLFFDAHALRAVTGLPLLGVITRVVSSAEKRRKRTDLILFMTVLAGFVLLYGGTLLYVVRTIFRGGV